MNGSVSSPAGLKSVSRDASKFILPAYSLKAGAAYTIALSFGGASASVGILVAVGSVRSVVAGGLARSLREQTTLTLDASQSYDEDVAALTGVRAGLRFAWYVYMYSNRVSHGIYTFYMVSIIVSINSHGMSLRYCKKW